MNRTQLTQEGFEKLQTELNQLKNTKRPTAVDRLAKARGMGDLSENSEYVAAKEDLAFIDERIIEIEQILNTTQIINHSTVKPEEVELGETVEIELNGERQKFTIVGDYETDPMSGKLSSSSPIGKALLGRKIGEQVEITVPAGKVTYKIVAIK